MNHQLTGIAVAVLLAVANTAIGHGDEDHGDATKAKKAAPVQRAPATTDHASAGAVAAEAESPQRLADGSVFLPKPIQHRLGLRTTLAAIADHPRGVELSGRIIADPNAGGRVQAAQSGRVEPGPKGLAVIGRQVSRGEVLAYVRHVEDPIERSRQQAQLTELATQLELAKKRYARLQQLEGSVPQREIEAARLEVEGLEERRAAIGASLTNRETLLAPVSGVISAANAVTGQVVEARETLFEIVDPQRLMVEALAYDPSLASGLSAATTAVGDKLLSLEFVGGGRSLREQALPLTFRVRPPLPPLVVGQPLKVFAATRELRKGAVLPAAALIRSGTGDSQIWVSESAERFSPRRVRAEPLDAERTVVTDGLKGGERVVIHGAAALSQVR